MNTSPQQKSTDQFYCDIKRGNEIDDDTIKQISNIFRETFNNPPYNQYLVYPSIGEPIAPREVFSTDEFVPLQQLDAFDPSQYQTHPQTGEKAIFWTDPEITKKRLRKKFRSNMHIVILRKEQNNDIGGLAIGYEKPLKQSFLESEWHNPYYYTDIESPHLKSFDDFYQKILKLIGNESECNPYTKFFILDFLMTTPKTRGFENYVSLVKGLFNSLPEYLKNSFVLAESLHGSMPYLSMLAGDGRVADSFMGEGHHIIAAKIKNIIELFNKQHKQIRQTIVKTRKQCASIDNLDYKPHYADNPKIEIKDTKNYGKGVFAKESIETGEVIAVFDGPVYRAKKLSDLPNDPPIYLRDHVIQVSETEYVHAENKIVEHINHSCDPNCCLGDAVTVVARRKINAGEELGWDYAMSEDSDWLMQNCQCGSARCRGNITAYRDLPEHIKIEYGEQISPWIAEKYNIKL